MEVLEPESLGPDGNELLQDREAALGVGGTDDFGGHPHRTFVEPFGEEVDTGLRLARPRPGPLHQVAGHDRTEDVELQQCDLPRHVLRFVVDQRLQKRLGCCTLVLLELGAFSNSGANM